MDQDSFVPSSPESTFSSDQLSYGLRIIVWINMILWLLPRVNFQCRSTPYGIRTIAWIKIILCLLPRVNLQCRSTPYGVRAIAGIKICADISDPRHYQPCQSLDTGKILHLVWVALLLRQL